jgi:glycine dehydrogenase
MLDTLGFASRAALIDAVIPASIRRAEALPLGPFAQPKSEAEAPRRAARARGQEPGVPLVIGQGYYDTHTPAVILRNVLENPAWYTAYTPYQPEISQGRLEALLNFQQMVVDLTGLAISNASLLDEATAAAEAMTLLQRTGKPKSNVFYVADDVLPQTLEVVRTRAADRHRSEDRPGRRGCAGRRVRRAAPVSGRERRRARLPRAHRRDPRGGRPVVVAADLLALTVLTPPGEWGADVAVGNTQRFGVPMGFGGPHAAYMAVRDEFKRQMPGRLVGVTVDAQGKPALRLALQTREQHIRREKATSNICTAQVLLAIMASMYAVYHGPHGLKTIALRVNRIAALLAAGVKQLGFTTVNDTFFDTLTIDAGARTAQLHAFANAKRINLRRVSDTQVGVSVDETTTRDDLADLLAVFAQAAGGTAPDVDALDAGLPGVAALPAGLERTSAYLTHPCSTATIPKPRCCATCAACRTRTSRSTAR